MGPQDRLTAWIKRELTIVPAATLFNLRVHDSTTGASELVDKFTVPSKLPNPQEAADELSREIYTRARDVSKTMGHIAKFAVSACVSRGRGTGKAEKRSGFPFNLRGEAYGGEMGIATGLVGESEPPSPTGLQAQLMRHLEAKERIAQEKDIAITEGILRENRRLQEANEKLVAQLEAGREAREELLDKTLERKLTFAKAEADERRKDQLLQVAIKDFFPHLAKYIPVVVDKILPGAGAVIGSALPKGEAQAASEPAPPGEAEALRKELVELFTSIPEEQQNKLLESLPPDKAEKLLKILGVP